MCLVWCAKGNCYETGEESRANSRLSKIKNHRVPRLGEHLFQKSGYFWLTLLPVPAYFALQRIMCRHTRILSVAVARNLNS
ncbi:hypothetical protein Mal48_27270 [Thalassoglobus polymorphus]|uniref:Uncharacterized protein n=1 Tax=Thalassoglobus polymorphus TaxID=2527994 RepID=A0A517QPE5_9PLAN|nr:hypothetical protein Mal48_27270 [Thalassoglobus polymorphus]